VQLRKIIKSFLPKERLSSGIAIACVLGGLFAPWVLGFGLWALGFGLWALGFGLWALGFGLWALGFDRRYRGGHRAPTKWFRNTICFSVPFRSSASPEKLGKLDQARNKFQVTVTELEESLNEGFNSEQSSAVSNQASLMTDW